MWFKDQIADALAGGTVNDAAAYGVETQPAHVEKGQPYWKVIKVHHLSPVENHGNHNLYVDLLDEDGNRIYGAKARMTWQGGQGEATIDKPENEPGTNFPLWKNQVGTVEGVGLPSDKAINLHSGHPDEIGPPAWGNTLFHHSFYVVFQRTIKADLSNSIIEGTVINGAGMTIVLSSDGQTVTSQVIGADGSYRFADLSAGSFTVAVSGTDVSQSNIHTDGKNVVTVNLTVEDEQPPENSVIEGTVINGAGMTIVLSSDGQTVTSQVVGVDGSYRFADLPAGSFTVAVSGTDVSQANIPTDGANVFTVNLTVGDEQPTKPLPFYLLFGSPSAPGTRTNFVLAQNYVLKVGALCGFSVNEASNARRVLIVGDTSAVSAEDEAKLVAAGCQVSRLSGDSYVVERAFADLMAQG
jgi:hypothetical protein